MLIYNLLFKFFLMLNYALVDGKNVEWYPWLIGRSRQKQIVMTVENSPGTLNIYHVFKNNNINSI